MAVRESEGKLESGNDIESKGISVIVEGWKSKVVWRL